MRWVALVRVVAGCRTWNVTVPSQPSLDEWLAPVPPLTCRHHHLLDAQTGPPGNHRHQRQHPAATTAGTRDPAPPPAKSPVLSDAASGLHKNRNPLTNRKIHVIYYPNSENQQSHEIDVNLFRLKSKIYS